MTGWIISFAVALAIGLFTLVRGVVVLMMFLTFGLAGVVPIAAWSWLLYGPLIALPFLAPAGLKLPAVAVSAVAIAAIAFLPGYLGKAEQARFLQALRGEVATDAPKVTKVSLLDIEVSRQLASDAFANSSQSPACDAICLHLLKTGQVDAIRMTLAPERKDRHQTILTRVFRWDHGCDAPDCLRPAPDPDDTADLRVKVVALNKADLPQQQFAPLYARSAKQLQIRGGDRLLVSQVGYDLEPAFTPYLVGINIRGGLEAPSELGAMRRRVRGSEINVAAAIRAVGLDPGPVDLSSPAHKRPPPWQMSPAYAHALIDHGLDATHWERDGFHVMLRATIAEMTPEAAPDLRRFYIFGPAQGLKARADVLREPQMQDRLVDEALHVLAQTAGTSDMDGSLALETLLSPLIKQDVARRFEDRFASLVFEPELIETKLLRKLRLFTRNPIDVLLQNVDAFKDHPKARFQMFVMINQAEPQDQVQALGYLQSYAQQTIANYKDRDLSQGSTYIALKVLAEHGRQDDVRDLVVSANIWNLERQLKRLGLAPAG